MYFRKLLQEQERARACKVVSHDSLPCKPSHNWSQNVMSERTESSGVECSKMGWRTNIHYEG
jgi:hypothetical protein